MGTQRLWRLGLGGIALGGAMMLAGLVFDSEFGALARGYGLLIVLAGLYLVVGLVARHVLAHVPERTSSRSVAAPPRAEQLR